MRDTGTLRTSTTLLAESTRISTIQDPGATRAITVLAPPEDQAFASAALDAALARGVRLPRSPTRSVRVSFAGAAMSAAPQEGALTAIWMREALAQLPAVQGTQDGETLVLRTPLRANGVEAVRLLSRVVEAVYADDVSGLEPNVMSTSKLARWSRPIGFDPAKPSDEGDRRWFWAMALMLLLAEARLRRSPSASTNEGTETEARVA
jgi:hypothetical protein